MVGGRHWGGVGQRIQNFSQIGRMSAKDLLYRVVTRVTNNVLHSLKILREWILSVLPTKMVTVR
jgi:hypothetical protein